MPLTLIDPRTETLVDPEVFHRDLDKAIENGQQKGLDRSDDTSMKCEKCGEETAAKWAVCWKCGFVLIADCEDEEQIEEGHQEDKGDCKYESFEEGTFEGGKHIDKRLKARRFKHCRFVNAKFTKVDFQNRRFSYGDFAGAIFIECDFSHAVFENCTFRFAKVEKCNFEHSSLFSIDFFRSLFCRGTSLIGCSFKGSHVFETNFDTCLMETISFEEAKLDSGSKFSDCLICEDGFKQKKLFIKSQFNNCLFFKRGFWSKTITKKAHKKIKTKKKEFAINYVSLGEDIDDEVLIIINEAIERNWSSEENTTAELDPEVLLFPLISKGYTEYDKLLFRDISYGLTSRTKVILHCISVGNLFGLAYCLFSGALNKETPLKTFFVASFSISIPLIILGIVLSMLLFDLQRDYSNGFSEIIQTVKD